VIFRKSGEINKIILIWAAISAFRSRFFEETSTSSVSQKELRSSRAAKLIKNYAKQKIVTLYFSGFRGRIIIDVSFQ
jgi:hypothetical protein